MSETTARGQAGPSEEDSQAGRGTGTGGAEDTHQGLPPSAFVLRGQGTLPGSHGLSHGEDQMSYGSRGRGAGPSEGGHPEISNICVPLHADEAGGPRAPPQRGDLPGTPHRPNSRHRRRRPPSSPHCPSQRGALSACDLLQPDPDPLDSEVPCPLPPFHLCCSIFFSSIFIVESITEAPVPLHPAPPPPCTPHTGLRHAMVCLWVALALTWVPRRIGQQYN